MPTVAGRYVLGNILGRGGMGLVREATDKTLQRTVAIKLLNPEHLGNKRIVTRFFNEARVLAMLTHPGTVPVHDAGMLEGDQPFYAMEKVLGCTLTEVLEQHACKTLSCPHTIIGMVDIFERICQTVAYAHFNGVVHRDLKPENIMVADYGQVLVLDWGLSKQIAAGLGDSSQDLKLTMEGEIQGTPAHMSPEQAKGQVEEVDYRTDVFALGILLYQILTGRKPFKGDTLVNMLDNIMHHDPPPPKSIVRCANRELSSICMKALSKDPQQRYRTACELSEDIRAFQENREVSAHPIGVVGHTIKAAKRHPAVAAVLLTIMVFAGIAVSAKELQAKREDSLIKTHLNDAHSLRTRVDASRSSVREALDTLATVPVQNKEWRHSVLDTVANAKADEYRYMRKLKVTLAVIIGRTNTAPSADALVMYRKLLTDEIQVLIRDGRHDMAEDLIEDILRSCETTTDNLLCWTGVDEKKIRALKATLEK